MSRYVLKLYINNDQTPCSKAAQQQVQAACEALAAGQAELQTVDVFEQQDSAKCNGILVTPTLVLEAPGKPAQRFAGDMAGIQQQLERLGLHKEAHG